MPLKLSFSTLSTTKTLIQDWPAPACNSTTPGQLGIALYNIKSLSGGGTLLKLYFDINDKAKKGKSNLKLKTVKFNDGKVAISLKDGIIKILTPKKRRD